MSLGGSKMEIGLINDYPPFTGIGNYAFSLFSEYKKMSKNVEMLYLQYEETSESFDEHMTLLETPFKLPILNRTLNGYYYFPRKIPERFDLYHVSNHYLGNIAKYRKPCIISCMDIVELIFKEEYPFGLRFFLERIVKQFDEAEKIIAISKQTKKDLVERYGISEDKIQVIYLACDNKKFLPRDKISVRKKLGLPTTHKIILHVGSEGQKKNIPVLMEAFYNLQKKFTDSILIRIGEKSRDTEKLIKKFKIGDKVKYYANLPSENIALFYNAADLFVFPSIYEGFGLPALESMASGTPLITSNAGPLPEVVGRSKYMIDPLDVEGLTNNILEVLSSEKISNKLIEKGLKRCKLFSWIKTATETLKVYEDVT